MSLIRKHECFRGHPIAAQCREELQTLIDRHAKVLFVGDDQRRRLDICSGQMWRAAREMTACYGTPWRTAGLPVGEPKLFAFQRHRFEVEYAVMGDGRLEPAGMPDDPIDRISAIACAGDGRTLRINVRQFYDAIEDGVEIRYDFTAPVLRDLVYELLP